MSAQHTSDSGIPLARLEFAQRLRELRVPRGFRTARSLARALDIDENRYTRYERAEVEPDLTMIRRICEMLDVTPDTLLCPGAPRDTAEPQPGPPSDGQNGSYRGSTPRASDLQTSAWLLAEAATALLNDRAAPDDSGAPAPLASVAGTCKVYKALMERPFETIAELLTHFESTQVDLPTANMLRGFIDQFVSIIKARG